MNFIDCCVTSRRKACAIRRLVAEPQSTCRLSSPRKKNVNRIKQTFLSICYKWPLVRYSISQPVCNFPKCVAAVFTFSDFILTRSRNSYLLASRDLWHTASFIYVFYTNRAAFTRVTMTRRSIDSCPCKFLLEATLCWHSTFCLLSLPFVTIKCTDWVQVSCSSEMYCVLIALFSASAAVD